MTDEEIQEALAETERALSQELDHRISDLRQELEQKLNDWRPVEELKPGDNMYASVGEPPYARFTAGVIQKIQREASGLVYVTAIYPDGQRRITSHYPDGEVPGFVAAEDIIAAVNRKATVGAPDGDA